MHMVVLACLTGFVGDFLLQMGADVGYDPGNLLPYFKQHGRPEALCIGGGLMAICYYLYSLFLPYNFWYLALYGVLLDIFFRYTMFFDSLRPYYADLSPWWSMSVGGAMPAVLPFLISKLL